MALERKFIFYLKDSQGKNGLQSKGISHCFCLRTLERSIAKFECVFTGYLDD